MSLEATALGRRLADPERFGATRVQPAVAGALQGRLRHGTWRHELTVLYEDLAFLLLNAPSFVPFQAIPRSAEVGPQVLLAAATDYCFPRAHLTLGLAAGALWPAWIRTTMTGSAVGSAGATTTADHVVVISAAARF